MSLLLALPLIAFNAAILLRSGQAGVATYLLLSLVAPRVSLGGTPVGYEILALPVVLFLVALRRPRLEYPRFHLYVAVFFLVLLAGTLLGTLRYGSTLDWIRFQGMVRFLVILSLTREVLHRRHLERVLLATVAVNAAVGLIQLFVPGLGATFLQLYGRIVRSPLEKYALEDFIPRATGTFDSPVVLGGLALIVLAAAWGGLLSGRRGRRYGWLLVLAGICGIVSLTKTFVIGAPVLLAGGLALSLASGGNKRFRFRPRTFFLAAGSVAIAVALAFWLGAYLQSLGFNVAYYARYLADPRAALATRYGAGGSVAGAVEVFQANPLLGVGVTRARGEFIGDSTYTLLLHSSGIVGGALAIGALLGIFLTMQRHHRPTDLLVVGALLLAGLAHPILFSLPGAITLAYLFATEGRPARPTSRHRAAADGARGVRPAADRQASALIPRDGGLLPAPRRG